MKKLFRFFILATMAVALVAPFNKPKTVEASTLPPQEITIKAGETKHLTVNVVADPAFTFYDAEPSVEKDSIQVISDDPNVVEVRNLKAVDGGKKTFDLQGDDNVGKTGEFESADISFDIVGKANGSTTVRIHNGNHVVRPFFLIDVGSSSANITMYRLYNPNSGEHFFTSSETERSHLISIGWKDEKIAWIAPTSGDPVYRLYNKNGGEHHYTLSAEERDNLKKAGWNDEGIGWYSDPNHGVSVYRVYNPNKFANNHHYTTSAKERDNLVSAGWRDEKIAWYGVE